MRAMTMTGLFHGFVNLHLTVYRGGSGSLVRSVAGGFIGGVIVLFGVLFAEYLSRKRDRANRFDDAMWRVIIKGTELFIPTEGLTEGEKARASLLFFLELGRWRSRGRPPLRNHHEIADEIGKIMERNKTAGRVWRSEGTVPNAQDIIGFELAKLGSRPRHFWN